MIKAPPDHTYTEENLMRTFPTSLGVYENVQELWRTVAQRYEEYYNEIEAVLIYPAIDNMPEDVLDILAQDLKVDWYDYNLSLESKRELIKTSVYVHKFLGTPAAVERMLQSVFPGSCIEEWYEYGGLPHHFQVVIEVWASRDPANTDDILRAVNMVKRLSSWLDGIVFQCNMGIIIDTTAKGYQAYSTWPGAGNCGTYPWRTTQGVAVGDQITIQSKTQSWSNETPMAGTIPWRTTQGKYHTGSVDLETQAKGFGAESAYAGKSVAGTGPWRTTQGVAKDDRVTVQTHTDSYGSASPMAGTIPWRTTGPGMEDLDVTVNSAAESYGAASNMSGEKDPMKPVDAYGQLLDSQVTVESAAKSAIATAAVSGKPEKLRPNPATSCALPNGLRAVIETKPFRVQTRWCGQAYAGKYAHRKL